MIIQMLLVVGCVVYIVSSHMMDKSLFERYPTIFIIGEFIAAFIGLIMALSLLWEFAYGQA
jgi:hypothetical protein